MKIPIIILCLIIISYCRNHDISAKYYDECYFLVHFAWLVLRLTLSIEKKNISLFKDMSVLCLHWIFFVNIWCALVSRYSYLKNKSCHIWMNHCEHKIHHSTTTFRPDISYIVAYMWCSHRRFKNAVLPVFNASIKFNFNWFLIKWYVLA